jgi:hypothetical protein
MEPVLIHYGATTYIKEPPSDTRRTYVPLWPVFLIYMVQQCTWSYYERRKTFHNPEVPQAIWDTAELLLKYGGYGSSFLLFAHSENTSVPTFVITLREFICRCAPRNQEALLQVIDKDVPSSFRSLLKKWRNTRQRNSEPSFNPAQYKPFELSMWEDSQDKYDLYSVWSAGRETKAQGLTFRVS